MDLNTKETERTPRRRRAWPTRQRSLRSGQWLVAGGFLVLSLLAAVVLTKTGLQFATFDRSNENLIFTTLSDEFDNVLVILLNETTSLPSATGTFNDYLTFSDVYATSRGVQLSQFLIAGVPTPTGINLTVVNYENQPVTNFRITVNGVPSVLTDISDRDSRSYSMTTASDRYNVTYSGQIVDKDNEPLLLSQTIIFDRRAFGILELEIRATDYVRRETIVR